ncbi:MAG: hypothetical protein ACRC8M_01480 [Cetobacterium sp.]|uniref:hypothetical protein n=1 Tax=Cetobacterium sp. TaxID=2071632 RepID=UPI003F38EE66
MKNIFWVLMLLSYVKSYSEITLKIHEPIRFESVNTKAVGDLVVGRGTIEVISDDLEVDRNKKFVFRFPKKGLMTNKKRWVQIDKYIMEDSDKTFRVTKERKLVKIFAIIERRKLNDQMIKAEDLEGEYIGYVPIIVEQYGQPIRGVDNGESKDDKNI